MSKKYPKLGSVLKKLLFNRGIRAADLSRDIKIPAPTIHRLVTGKTIRPYRSSLKPIADYFSLNIEQLLGEEPLPLELLGKSEDGQYLSTNNKIKHIPLIAWEKIFSQDRTNNNSNEKIPFLGDMSEEGFATIMPDSSMEPVFPSGSILIFDTNKSPKDRSYVLAQMFDSQFPIFRQLLVDLEHQYLKSLNPDLNISQIRLLRKSDKIYAILVESRRSYESL